MTPVLLEIRPKKLLFMFLVFAAGLLLVAASFVYLVDSHQAQRLLGQLRVLLIVLLVAFVVVAVVRNTDRLSVITGLLALSIVAYLVRKYRKPKRDKRPSLSGIERKPVLPSVKAREKEQEQQ